MTLTPAKSIRATATIFGAGPGMRRTSFIHFKRDGDVFRVSVGGSAGDDGSENLGDVAESAGWRGRVQFLLDNAEQPEGVLPTEVRISGAKGIEAQMLALAWSGTDGAQAAQGLLELTDAELLRLADSSRIFDSIEPLREIDEILDSDTAAIRDAIRAVLAGPSFEWDAVLTEARRVADEREAEDLAASQARESALAPYAADVERLTKAWWGFSGGAGGVVHQWLTSARQGAVRRFLEAYVLSHGAFPGGKHRLSFKFMNGEQSLDLDMDALQSYVSTKAGE